MTTEQLKRANEITDRIAYLQSFIDGEQPEEKTSFDDARSISFRRMKQTDRVQTWNDSDPDGFTAFIKDEVRSIRDRVINKMRKEIKSLTTELEKL